MADFYELLGVGRGATVEELKRAYRLKARALHPDANPDDPTAEERFKAVARAYEVLSDPETRERYDRFGEAGLGGATSNGASEGFGGGIGDLFDAFFGGNPFGGGGGRGAGGPAGPPRGQDVEAIAELDFEVAVFGSAHALTFQNLVRCGDCNGSGAGGGTLPVTCSDCNGAGSVRRVRQSLLGQMVTAMPCNRCGGLGQVVVTPCAPCRGEGRIRQQMTLTIDVPAGVDGGQTLRLAGRGAAGPRGGPNGDLFVHLKVRPHQRFVRDGDDLVMRLPVTISQAALGVHTTIETLDGTEDLLIPSGTQHAREFRLRGRGVPHVQAKGRGDLRVVVNVEVPSKLTRAQEELLRRFAAESGDEVMPADDTILGRIKSAFR